MRRSKLWIASTALLALAACEAPERPVERAEVPVLTFEQFRTSVTKTFEGRGIYVVDGDIAIPANELRGWYERYVHEVRGTEARCRVRLARPSTVNRSGGADDIWSARVRPPDLSYCVTNDFGGNKTADGQRDGPGYRRPRGRRQLRRSVYDPSQDGKLHGFEPERRCSRYVLGRSGGACAFFPSGGGCVVRTVVIDINDLDTNPAYGNGHHPGGPPARAGARARPPARAHPREPAGLHRRRKLGVRSLRTTATR